MAKRVLPKVYIALWMLLLVVLGSYYLFLAPRDGVYSQQENRTLAGFPELTAENIFDGSFGEAIETYLLDRFPGRNTIITAVNRLESSISMASHEEYLRITKGVEDPLDVGDYESDLQAILAELATETTAPQDTEPEETAPAQDGNTEPTEPDESLPVEDPPIVPKPEASPTDFPYTLGMYMEQGEGKTWEAMSFHRDNVVALTAVLDKYASLLPENGKLIFTIGPPSYMMNIYVNQEEKGAFYNTWDEMVTALGDDNVYAIDATEILAEAIREGEYVAFRTDNHWTPYGGYLIYRQMADLAGKTLCNYPDDFDITVEEFRGTYFRDDPSAYWTVEPDTLELLMPKIPVENRRIIAPDEYEVIPFLNLEASANDRYTVYMSGPGGPWRYVVCDNDETENCLVITDSFGLSVIPFLTYNYKEVHYYDPRFYNGSTVGYTVTEMIQNNNIQDIYVIVADFHTFNSSFLIGTANYQLKE